ncbi:HAD hydrolase-like protein|uniref:HAD family hydrolase n=1 Tax=Pseudomonas sp. SbOxS1 TaxID=2723884 RepID=UPI0015D104EB|nr:HAD family hydrolase [Pseudomonas sp. SbOxS1]NYU04871.1 HAD hydrolase-like protein [Pseudomonas sp. SbOxS1]
MAKAVFCDIRDTLGIVDYKGHLVLYRPTSVDLLKSLKAMGLRVGLITNLPSDVSTQAGLQMVKDAGIDGFIDPDGFVTNHDANADKPDPAIYRFAAAKMGLLTEDCIFIGENLSEVVGAQAAGMGAVLKPFPPGREFLQKPLAAGQISDTSSGRLSEVLLEEDHLIAKRIVLSAVKLKEKLDALGPSDEVRTLLRPMGLIVWLTNNFVDTYHHRKEEEVLFPFAMMCGVDPADLAGTLVDHDQGRAYFRAMGAAYRRVCMGNRAATVEFAALLGAFANLYKTHGKYEDDILFKKIGDRLSDQDDALMADLIGRIGPPDITLYINLIAMLEKELGL